MELKEVKTYADFVQHFKVNVVLCNNIVEVDDELCHHQDNDNANLKEGEEIFQYFIVDSTTADALKIFTKELVFYSDKLEVYVWGVTHYGTSWGSVNIELVNVN